MKSNNIFRFVFLTLFLFFIVLYITQALGYYEYKNKKTNILTEEAVKKFEEDIKKGKNVNASDYIKKENDYNNSISRFGITVSNVVGDVFNNVMGFIFNEVEKTVNE